MSDYKRILLKLSGESLNGGDDNFGIAPSVLMRIANEIKSVHDTGVQVAMVIGGGNLFRGAALTAIGLDRVTADQMGMLATVMNGLALRDMFEKIGVPTRVMSAIPIGSVVDNYDRRKAIYHLQNNRVVIFTAGTGNPFVTTDSAASLRGVEINADLILKATNVDGVFSSDPRKNPDAKLYNRLTYQEALEKELGVMDLAAFCQCRDYDMKLRVFNIHKSGALNRIIDGEEEGTLVTKGDLND